MDANMIAVAKAWLDGAANDTTTFPQIVGRLIEAGFERYIADFRRAVTIYDQPDGDSVVKPRPAPCRGGRSFRQRRHRLSDPRGAEPGPRLHLQRILRQDGGGGLRRLHGRVSRPPRRLFRSHRRNPRRAIPARTRASRPPGLAPGRELSHQSRTCSTTRRFWARPSRVLLGATGSSWP